MQNDFDTFHTSFNPEDMEMLSNLLIPTFQPSESVSPVPQDSSQDYIPDSPCFSHAAFAPPMVIKAEPLSPQTPAAPRVAQFPQQMSTVPVYHAGGAPLLQTNSMAALMSRGARAAIEALNSSSSDEYEERAAPGKMSGRSASPVQNEEERIVRRRKKNREAAQQSRLRKRMKLESLEGQLNEQRQIHEYTLNQKSALEHENLSLRKQVEYLKEVLRNCSMKIDHPLMGRVAV